MIRAIIFACLAVLISTSAYAQTKKPQLPFDPLHLNQVAASDAQVDANLDQLWQKIVSATQADLTYAKALADNVASPGSKLRSACYGALLLANQQANGTTLVDATGKPLVAPNPDAISKFEQAAELVDNLQPTAPVMAACAPAANAVKQSVAQLLTGMLAVVAVKAVVPLP